jgi:hypothetical protein
MSVLGERLRDAGTVTPALIADVISGSVRGLSPPWQAVRSKRVGQLIRLGAWTEAALELIELELPQWKMRRLVYDAGEWYCALSRQRELPDWLDQAVEGRHPDLALALLTALIEARCQASDAQATRVPRAPQGANAVFETMLSDNFA